MHLFDQSIADRLNHECAGEAIHFIGLGQWDFQLACGNIRMQNHEKVGFQLSKHSYVWAHGPSDAPVWLLLGQTSKLFILTGPHVLRMELASGDIIDFHTSERPSESHTVNFPHCGDDELIAIY